MVRPLPLRSLHRRPLTGLCAAVLAMAALTGACDSAETEPRSDGSGWSRMPAPPASIGRFPALAGGPELVAIGGHRLRGETVTSLRGAAWYDDATRRWTRLPAVPVALFAPAVVRTGEVLWVVGVVCPPEAAEADPECGSRQYKAYRLRLGDGSWTELPSPGSLAPAGHPNPAELGRVGEDPLFRFGTKVLSLRGETWRPVLDLRSDNSSVCLSGTKVVEAVTGLIEATVVVADTASPDAAPVELSTPVSGGPTRVACGSDGALLAPAPVGPQVALPLQHLEVSSGRLRELEGSAELGGADVVVAAGGRFFAWNSSTASGLMWDTDVGATAVPGPTSIGEAVVAGGDAYVKLFDDGYFRFRPGDAPFEEFPTAR